jgi:hypothetical protein
MRRQEEKKKKIREGSRVVEAKLTRLGMGKSDAR